MTNKNILKFKTVIKYIQTGDDHIIGDDIESSNYFKGLKGLSIYDKTLFIYILNYLGDPIFSYGYERWKAFSHFYCFNFGLIEEYVTIDNDSNLSNSGEYIFDPIFNQLADRGIIDDMFRYFLTIKYLNEIQIDNSLESIQENMTIYRDISLNVTMLNASIATRECMEKGYFDRAFTPQTESIGNIASIYNILFIIRYSYSENKDILEDLYCAYNNNISTYMDMLFLLLSIQIIKASPFINIDEKNACQSLIRIILKLLRGAKVIAIFKNQRFFDAELEWMNRGANNHTTRFQILYEYYNGDQYCLRLDLAHKGIEHFHLNNISKGGIEFFPINEDTYNFIIGINSDYTTWFFEYGNNLYFLKDNKKQEVYQSQHQVLLQTLQESRHFSLPCFSNEEVIIKILDMWTTISTNVGSWMPSEKINSQVYYRLRFTYEFVEEYFYRRNLQDDFDEDNFKAKIIAYFIKVNVFKENEIETLLSFSVSEILCLAISELKESFNE